MGGGAVRTVAKAAAFAAYKSPSSAATIRRSTLHPPVSSLNSVSASESITKPTAAAEVADSAVQWPAFDDWEFADAGSDHLDPPERLVFGSAPTMEEAKEATEDLKEALEKVYFSSDIAEDTSKVSHVSEPSGTAAILPSVVPQHVVQAFSLLQGSPEAQTVVASLASDKNVWDAVMKNQKVMEFYKNRQTILPPCEAPETNVASNESVEENETSKENLEDSSFFTDLVQNIKVKVSEMVSNISDILQDFMGTSTGNGGSTSTRTSTAESYVDFTIGASFLALAIAAIMVVLVKRGG